MGSQGAKHSPTPRHSPTYTLECRALPRASSRGLVLYHSTYGAYTYAWGNRPYAWGNS